MLYVAISERRDDAIKLLLDHGADPNQTLDKVKFPTESDMSMPFTKIVRGIQDVQGFNTTALYIAADSQKLDTVRLLLEHGANPNAISSGGAWHAAIIPPVLHEDAKMLELFLKHGADPRLVDEYSIGTLFEHKRKEMFSLLFSYGLSVTDFPNQQYYRTPSFKTEHPEMADFLLTSESQKQADDCRSMPIRSIPETCVPRELKFAQQELKRNYQILLATSNSKDGKTLQQEERKWIRQRKEICQLKFDPSSWDGWLSSLLTDRKMALCTLQETRSRADHLSKELVSRQ
jgi:uncharacterized protein YecT (DUF1311 family)